MKPDTGDKKRSPSREIWRRFRKSPTAVVGLIIITAFILVAVCAGLIVDEGLTVKTDGKNRLLPPSGEHFFGTDHMGRDLFARVLHGSRVSLSMGLVVVGIAVTAGSILGAAAGYYGGLFDSVLMRFLDVLTCVPSMLLILVIVSTLGAGLLNLLIALCIGSVPGICRMVRSQVISLSDMEYIQAARAFGGSDLNIIIKHVLPNAMGLIIITATGMVAGTILMAAGMSFLGFGVQPPAPEWGSILNDARPYLREAPHMMVIPGVAMVISALSINLVGDGLRDALDPRLKD